MQQSILNTPAVAGRPSNIGRMFVLSFALTLAVLATTVYLTDLFWLAGAGAGAAGWLFFLFTARESDDTTAMTSDKFLLRAIAVLLISASAYFWLLLWWGATAVRAYLPG